MLTDISTPNCLVSVSVSCVYLQARHVKTKITQSNPKLTRTIQAPAQETSH